MTTILRRMVLNESDKTMISASIMIINAHGPRN